MNRIYRWVWIDILLHPTIPFLTWRSDMWDLRIGGEQELIQMRNLDFKWKHLKITLSHACLQHCFKTLLYLEHGFKFAFQQFRIKQFEAPPSRSDLCLQVHCILKRCLLMQTKFNLIGSGNRIDAHLLQDNIDLIEARDSSSVVSHGGCQDIL